MANANPLKKISIVQSGGASETKDVGAEAQYIDISYNASGEAIIDITDPSVTVDSVKSLPTVVNEINGDIVDLENDIDNVETDVSTKAAAAAIGPVEEGTTSTTAYATGEHFYKNGAFCTALTAISIGDLFVLEGEPNANYKEGTISADLKSGTNFVGTMQEWNNLTTDVKKTYQTVDIISE